MRETILDGCPQNLGAARPVEGADHGEHKFMREREALDTAGADGCGNCGEEFAEASVLSGLAGGKAEPGSAATLCGTILQARGSVSEAPARAGCADRRTAAGINPGEPGGGGESHRTAPEALAGFCSGRGSRRGRHYVLPCSAWNEGGGAKIPGDLRGPSGGGSSGGALRL